MKRVIFPTTKYIQGANELAYLVALYPSNTLKMVNLIGIYF